MNEKKKRNQYKFDKEKYDHIHLQTPKGKKEIIKSHAEKQGKSLNAFVNEAIEMCIRDRIITDILTKINYLYNI